MDQIQTFTDLRRLELFESVIAVRGRELGNLLRVCLRLAAGDRICNICRLRACWKCQREYCNSLKLSAFHTRTFFQTNGTCLARFPLGRNRPSDKKSRQINKLERILVAKVCQLLRNSLQGRGALVEQNRNYPSRAFSIASEYSSRCPASSIAGPLTSLVISEIIQ